MLAARRETAGAMATPAGTSRSVPAGAWALAAVIIAAGTVGLFAIDTAGSRMFLSLVESGLAWCF